MRKEHKYVYLMVMLDQLLTNKSHETCVHTFKNSIVHIPEDFINGELYYLSDGGYSRIKFDDLYMRVLLTSGSPKVIDHWYYPHVQIIVGLLDSLLTEIYTTMLSR